MKNAPLATGQVYHVYSKSIAEYVIFNLQNEYLRMYEALRFYQDTNARTNFSVPSAKPAGVTLVQIVAYCLMPTHLHLILKQMTDNGISVFMNRVLNSYTRYFNEKNGRKGPLWEGRFKRILVENEEYLLHLTRYIHLNPVTAYLVNTPEAWIFSSFHEYIGLNHYGGICKFKDLLDISPETYKEFVRSRIDEQRALAHIKHLLID